MCLEAPARSPVPQNSDSRNRIVCQAIEESGLRARLRPRSRNGGRVRGPFRFLCAKRPAGSRPLPSADRGSTRAHPGAPGPLNAVEFGTTSTERGTQNDPTTTERVVLCAPRCGYRGPHSGCRTPCPGVARSARGRTSERRAPGRFRGAPGPFSEAAGGSVGSRFPDGRVFTTCGTERRFVPLDPVESSGGDGVTPVTPGSGGGDRARRTRTRARRDSEKYFVARLLSSRIEVQVTNTRSIDSDAV
ncbi:hypothetical protein FTUN_0211 [Frigoriglobus tundricola]|uniref:Uncharacterized protein n=1 Tax=Frigoriglobus tundricola TaxID=2774151 RepID=A0A6M5YGJ5_9BACT|nr:hypothetical protein FTUN_0211 [Frigoriglobus tundricola]